MKVVYFMVLQYLRVYCNEANDNSDDDDDDSTEIYHSANTYIQSEGDVMLESINTGRSSLAVMELNHGGDYKAYTSSDTEIYDDNDSTESDDETTAVNNSTIQSDDFKTEAQRTDEKYNSDDNVRNFLENLFDVVPYPKYNDIPMLNRKIFRGVRVTIMEHPYIVSIRRQLVHYLMGAILTRNVIITVAHPIYQVPITELKVIAGQNYNDRGTTLHTVILTIIHEDFQPSNLQADLALLMTFEFIVFK
ncbi:unnamed protein product [Diatraea saccharalis]|uniref:Peptidase S1 domain-containing protein n=1 Tax=Diatraea saccharalis TaxID=40085 RepID=A0A9N9N1I8_9NEOP|nr:unnamed protein product [Diatraea saccharalis]